MSEYYLCWICRFHVTSSLSIPVMYAYSSTDCEELCGITEYKIWTAFSVLKKKLEALMVIESWNNFMPLDTQRDQNGCEVLT